jgi:hypothetical protein
VYRILSACNLCLALTRNIFTQKQAKHAITSGNNAQTRRTSGNKRSEHQNKQNDKSS